MTVPDFSKSHKAFMTPLEHGRASREASYTTNFLACSLKENKLDLAI